MKRPATMAAHMLAIACIVALVLPAAGGARVMDSKRTTTISVHQDANTTVPSNATTLLHHPVAIPCNGTAETGWQKARDVLNFHMRASMWLLKKSPAAIMWITHAAVWLIVAWIFYGGALVLVVFGMMTFCDILLVVHLCYTHRGWDRKASEAYKEQSVWKECATKMKEADEKRAKDKASRSEAQIAAKA